MIVFCYGLLWAASRWDARGGRSRFRRDTRADPADREQHAEEAGASPGGSSPARRRQLRGLTSYWSAAGVTLAGIGLGSAAAVVDSLSSGNNKWRALDLVLNAAWLWAGVAVLAGRVQRKNMGCRATAAAALLGTVLAYWVTNSLLSGETTVSAFVAEHSPLARRGDRGRPAARAGGTLDASPGHLRACRAAADTGCDRRGGLVLHALPSRVCCLDPWLSWTHAAMPALAARVGRHRYYPGGGEPASSSAPRARAGQTACSGGT